MAQEINTLNVVIDKDLERRVKRLAEREQRSVSAQIRVMLEDWFESFDRACK